MYVYCKLHNVHGILRLTVLRGGHTVNTRSPVLTSVESNFASVHM